MGTSSSCCLSPSRGVLLAQPTLTGCCPPQKREAFCQLLQLMKNKHSKQDEPDMISVFIGSWNMGQARGGGAAGVRKRGTLDRA